MAKGSVDYHERIDFRALDVFVDAISKANKKEIKAAMDTANEMTKATYVRQSDRPIWKDLTALLRKEYRRYG